jgi:Bacterial mobilisation protein (MobC)
VLDSEQCFRVTKTLVRGTPPETPSLRFAYHCVPLFEPKITLMDRKPSQGRPGGRPRKDDRTLRDQWLRARVTADELHRVEQLARDANKTPSDFIRDASLLGRIQIKHYRAPDPNIINELQRIGNNLNQIARICNTTGDARRARNIELHIAEDLRPILQLLLKQYAP